jgi:hypothetical protein
MQVAGNSAEQKLTLWEAEIATGSPLLYIVGPNIVKLTLDHRGLISRALDEWAEPEAGM